MDKQKWETAKTKIALDAKQQAAAKATQEKTLGLTKLPRGVPCEGCGNNNTRNQDK